MCLLTHGSVLLRIPPLRILAVYFLSDQTCNSWLNRVGAFSQTHRIFTSKWAILTSKSNSPQHRWSSYGTNFSDLHKMQLFTTLQGALALESAISPRTSEFLLLENGLKNQHLGAKCACRYWCGLVSWPSPGTELGMYRCMGTHRGPHIYICLCSYHLYKY